MTGVIHGHDSVGKLIMSDFLPFSRPDLNEEDVQVVRKVIRSGWITTGPENQALEQEFCQLTGAKFAIAVSSATAAMHLSLLALGISPGDEVITPSMTWVSTANMISLLGAIPVMVDIDPQTLMVTAEQIAAAITPRTKAIIPVHFAGAPADMNAIDTLARRHQLPVIEDAAHALGTEYRGRPIGQRNTVLFSFHAIKNITCAEGGMIVTSDPVLAERIRLLRFHGLEADAFDRQTPGRAAHAQVVIPGLKYNLTDLQAAIARHQLSRLSEINDRRQHIALHYRQALADTPFRPLVLPEWPHRHAWHLFILRIDAQTCGLTRDEFMQQMKLRNIGTGLHFLAVHRQPWYRQQQPHLSLPHTEWNSDRLCSIPLFPQMTEQQCQRVINAIHDIARSVHVNH